MIVKYLAILLATASAYGATPACTTATIAPGGDAVVTRFIAAPMPRAREAVADAMQAAGVFIFRNTDQFLEGERSDERIKVLGLAPGDEKIRAELTPITQDGKTGTQVRVETLRRGNKNGAPKHTWSAAVLDHTACLVTVLSLDDPLRRPKLPTASGAEVHIADSTSIAVRCRHFFFNTDAKPNHVIPFETAEDLVIDGSTVIPAGLLVAAFMDQTSDVKTFGRGAKGQLQFKYLVMPDGKQMPLRGVVDLKGMNKVDDVIGQAVLNGGGLVGVGLGGLVTGNGFAIPAGTLFHVDVDGPQEIRLSRSAQGSP